MQPKPLPCTTKRERACVISSPSIIHHFAISVQTQTDETLRKHCNIPQRDETPITMPLYLPSRHFIRGTIPLFLLIITLYSSYTVRKWPKRTHNTNANLGSQPSIMQITKTKAKDTLHHHKSWSLHPSTRNRSRGPDQLPPPATLNQKTHVSTPQNSWNSTQLQ